MTTALFRSLVTLAAVALPLSGCGRDSVGAPTELLPLAAATHVESDDPPRFSEWSDPVHLGSVVNSASAEANSFISRNGLSLYFNAGRERGGFGLRDIWVSQRGSTEDPWGPPQNLGATINTAFHDGNPSLSLDEHRLYFASNRPGGLGQFDIYVSRRRDKRDDLGWQPPEHLGNVINTAFDEQSPIVLFEDDATGTIIAYFSSSRPGGFGGEDIYSSTLLPDGTFGPAELVAELSSPASDARMAIRRDGLEMILSSDRAGTLGNIDLWVATRASTAERWSIPVNLGPRINTAFVDWGPGLSFHGTELYFSSAFRPGNVSDMFDIWVTTRTRNGKPD